VDAKDSDDLQEFRWSPSNYPGSLTRAQLVDRYAQATGRDVSSMAFYLAFARFKVAVILQQIYYRYKMGLTQDQRFASLPRKIESLLRASLHAAETGKV
jgi:aminoglycoside phosphotransferase (APT) family kinase protein